MFDINNDKKTWIQIPGCVIDQLCHCSNQIGRCLVKNCLLLKKEKLRLVSNGISVHLGAGILKLATGSWGNYEL